MSAPGEITPNTSTASAVTTIASPTLFERMTPALRAVLTERAVVTAVVDSLGIPLPPDSSEALWVFAESRPADRAMLLRALAALRPDLRLRLPLDELIAEAAGTHTLNPPAPLPVPRAAPEPEPMVVSDAPAAAALRLSAPGAVTEDLTVAQDSTPPTQPDDAPRADAAPLQPVAPPAAATPDATPAPAKIPAWYADLIPFYHVDLITAVTSALPLLPAPAILRCLRAYGLDSIPILVVASTAPHGHAALETALASAGVTPAQVPRLFSVANEIYARRVAATKGTAL